PVSPTVTPTEAPSATVPSEDTITSSTTATATPTATPTTTPTEVVGSDEPEVLGEQASTDTSVKKGEAAVQARNPQAVPSAVNAGVESSTEHQRSLMFAWLAGLGALMGGLALLARRRRV
ncbi:MAG: hypothetical protein ABIR39_04530, partial [Nocardioides sp.]